MRVFLVGWVGWKLVWLLGSVNGGVFPLRKSMQSLACGAVDFARHVLSSGEYTIALARVYIY